MALVASGLLNKKVVGELGISETTVEAHRGNVMRKMRAGTLTDLVTMAARLRVALAAEAETPLTGHSPLLVSRPFGVCSLGCCRGRRSQQCLCMF